MKKLSKKLLSVLTAAAMIFTIFASPVGEILGFVGESVKASAATITEAQVWEKIEELKTLFPSGESYFTTTGTLSCSTQKNAEGFHEKCDYCYLGNIIKSNKTVMGTKVPNIIKNTGCWTCCAFARFAFCYIFEHDYADNTYKISSSSYGGVTDEFLSKLKPGDLLNCNGGSHYGIFLGYDSSYIYMYDANSYGSFSKRSMVQYNRKKPRSDTKYQKAYTKITAVRSYNYSGASDITENVTDYYKLTAPDGYQVIRSSYSTSSSELGRISVGDNTYILVTKYSPDKLWGYVTYNGISGWIRLYYVEKHDTHTYTSSITTAATCTTDGVKTFTCLCGESYTAAITKLGHSYTSSVTKAATCTATGVRTYKCSRCTSSYTESIAKTGHSYTTGYEAAHPHKNYKKCTVCSTVEYTGTTQYLYNCASCTNLTVPTITSVTSPANINKEVTIKWTASTSDKLGHYWVRILDPNGNVAVSKNLDTTVTSYTFTPTMTGEYTINVAATPTGSPDGTGSLWGNATITVHDIARYYEATHPHKYVDYCKNCDYMVYVGTNLGYYEKCKTCHDNVAPSKPVIKNVASTYTIGDDVIINWDATTNTTHYNLTVFKKNSNGEYEKLEWTPYVENGHVLTGYGVGDYKIYLDSYNSGYFYQYSESWRDWVHTQGDVVYFSICDAIVSPVITDITGKVEGGKTTITWTASPSTSALSHYWISISDPDGKFVVDERVEKTTNKFTFTPEKAGVYKVYVFAGDYTYESNFTVAPAKVAGFKSPSQSTTAIRLNWTKNANADGYVIEQYTSDGWVQIADITDKATTTYKVTGLKSGTAYKFRMKAYVNGTDGVVYGTKTATLTVNTMASSVSGLALKSRSASALRLKWTKNTAVDGYIIEQKIDGKWVQIADIDSYATTEYKVTGLAASTKYSFRMKAYAITKYGDKTYSGYTSTLSKTTSPANVTGLKIGGRAGTALRLNWDKNTSADGYIIEQYKGGKWTQIADITDNATTTYRVTGLEASTKYKFRVKAYNMVGTTALYSNYTATLAAYTNPSAVSGLKIAGKAGTALRLGWTQNTTADGYIIEQYIDGKWTRIARIAGNETLSYRVENLTKATTYKFRVATYNIEDNVAYYGAYVTISGTTL